MPSLLCEENEARYRLCLRAEATSTSKSQPHIKHRFGSRTLLGSLVGAVVGPRTQRNNLAGNPHCILLPLVKAQAPPSCDRLAFASRIFGSDSSPPRCAMDAGQDPSVQDEQYKQSESA